jgi:formylglycine-generating enzyme required for sulfatase activity
MGKKRIRYLHLNSFYIDKYEITTEQFQKFLRETASDKPPAWNDLQDTGLPVANLSYSMADNYCRWAGKRLPTELEWEKASRGPGILTSYIKDDVEFYREKINVYPTGLTFNNETCITAETAGKPVNVYLLKDNNYYGLYGMCGNAAEWTSSWYLPYRGNSIQNHDFGRKFKVIRGGAYNLPSKWSKSYERMIGGIPALNTDYRAGVRCVMDP